MLEKSTGLDDTPENRLKIRKWLDRVMMDIDNGRFDLLRHSRGHQSKKRIGRLEFHSKAADVLFKDGSWD